MIVGWTLFTLWQRIKCCVVWCISSWMWKKHLYVIVFIFFWNVLKALHSWNFNTNMKFELMGQKEKLDLCPALVKENLNGHPQYIYLDFISFHKDIWIKLQTFIDINIKWQATQFWSNHVNLLLWVVSRCFVNSAGNFNVMWLLKVQVYAGKWSCKYYLSKNTAREVMSKHNLKWHVFYKMLMWN